MNKNASAPGRHARRHPMDFALPEDLKAYLAELDDFIEREI